MDWLTSPAFLQALASSLGTVIAMVIVVHIVTRSVTARRDKQWAEFVRNLLLVANKGYDMGKPVRFQEVEYDGVVILPREQADD